MNANVIYVFSRTALSFVFGLTLLIQTSEAAFIYDTAGSTYVQDFDSLASAGSGIAWTNDVTLNGWYATTTSYNADDGNFNGAALLSYGVNGVNERALGAHNAAGSAIQFGMQLQNTTGLTLNRFDLAFIGEQWRNSGSTISNVMRFDYRIDKSDGMNAAAGTSVSALNFTSLHNSLGGPLDGNLAANRTSLSASVSGFNWAPNDYLLLRWTADSTAPGSKHGLAIDNVVFSATAVPEPSSLVFASATLSCLFFVRRIQKRLRAA